MPKFGGVACTGVVRITSHQRRALGKFMAFRMDEEIL